MPRHRFELKGSAVLFSAGIVQAIYSMEFAKASNIFFLDINKSTFGVFVTLKLTYLSECSFSTYLFVCTRCVLVLLILPGSGLINIPRVCLSAHHVPASQSPSAHTFFMYG